MSHIIGRVRDTGRLWSMVASSCWMAYRDARFDYEMERDIGSHGDCDWPFMDGDAFDQPDPATEQWRTEAAAHLDCAIAELGAVVDRAGAPAVFERLLAERALVAVCRARDWCTEGPPPGFLQ